VDAGSDVAVVIVNYDGERLLPDCLAALAAQTLTPAQIVVADNGSRDGSLALLRAQHPAVRALELGHNHGFAGGANRGVRATSAPWVCVLNSDATPAPDWLAQLTAAPRDARTWALGSVLVSASTGLIESAGDGYAAAGYAYKLLRERPLEELPAEPYRVFAAPGAAPVFRRQVFDLLGGYEERFFMYYEDVDLAFRAALAGYHALLVPRPASRIASARRRDRWRACASTSRATACGAPCAACPTRRCGGSCAAGWPSCASTGRGAVRPQRSPGGRRGSPGYRARCASGAGSRRGGWQRTRRSRRCCVSPRRSAPAARRRPRPARYETVPTGELTCSSSA